MHMALTRPWTRADLDRLPDDDGNRYEFIDGELLVTPAPRPVHEIIIEELGWLLNDYCRHCDIGRAYYGKSAVVTATSHVEPDIVVRRRVALAPATWDEMPLPILVVEVVSESTRRNDLLKKRAFYMENGIPEYWVVDADARTVLVIVQDGERLVSDAVRWQPLSTQPAFELDLPALFADVLG
jgi:Uma2 family endonuclease